MVTAVPGSPATCAGELPHRMQLTAVAVLVWDTKSAAPGAGAVFWVKVQFTIEAFAGLPKPSPTHTPPPGLPSPELFAVNRQLVIASCPPADTATPPPPAAGPLAAFPSNAQPVTVALAPLNHTAPPRARVLFWMKRHLVSIPVPPVRSPPNWIAPPPLRFGVEAVLRRKVQLVKTQT